LYVYIKLDKTEDFYKQLNLPRERIYSLWYTIQSASCPETPASLHKPIYLIKKI